MIIIIILLFLVAFTRHWLHSCKTRDYRVPIRKQNLIINKNWEGLADTENYRFYTLNSVSPLRECSRAIARGLYNMDYCVSLPVGSQTAIPTPQGKTAASAHTNLHRGHILSVRDGIHLPSIALQYWLTARLVSLPGAMLSDSRAPSRWPYLGIAWAVGYAWEGAANRWSSAHADWIQIMSDGRLRSTAHAKPTRSPPPL